MSLPYEKEFLRKKFSRIWPLSAKYVKIAIGENKFLEFFIFFYISFHL